MVGWQNLYSDQTNLGSNQGGMQCDLNQTGGWRQEIEDLKEMEDDDDAIAAHAKRRMDSLAAGAADAAAAPASNAAAAAAAAADAGDVEQYRYSDELKKGFSAFFDDSSIARMNPTLHHTPRPRRKEQKSGRMGEMNKRKKHKELGSYPRATAAVLKKSNKRQRQQCSIYILCDKCGQCRKFATTLNGAEILEQIPWYCKDNPEDGNHTCSARQARGLIATKAALAFAGREAAAASTAAAAAALAFATPTADGTEIAASRAEPVAPDTHLPLECIQVPRSG